MRSLFKFPLRKKSHLLAEQLETEKDFADSFKKFKLQQLKFQKDDKIPVFLKGGSFDKLLFFTTIGLSGFGLFGTFGFIYNMAFPKKKKTSE